MTLTQELKAIERQRIGFRGIRRIGPRKEECEVRDLAELLCKSSSWVQERIRKGEYLDGTQWQFTGPGQKPPRELFDSTGQTWPSLCAAAKAMGFKNTDALAHACRRKNRCHGRYWSRVSVEHARQLEREHDVRVFSAEDGCLGSVSEAAKHLRIQTEHVYRKCRRRPEKFWMEQNGKRVMWVRPHKLADAMERDRKGAA